MLFNWPLKAALGIILVAVCACSHPYRHPEFRGAQEFSGARDLAGSDGVVRMIMTHGMCAGNHLAIDDGGRGTENWVGARAEMIANIIGDKGYRHPQKYQVAAQYNGTASGPAVYRYDVNLTGSDGIRYEIKFLKWGMTFQSAYDALDMLENRIQTKPITRAKLNDRLKHQLMDDCLVDAVIYSGPRGNSLRAAYREAICDLMGGTIGGTNEGVQGKEVECSGARRFDPTPTVIVTESLGSKVMMDALNSITGSGSLGSVRAFHMAANQIPLLSQAELPAKGQKEASSERDVADNGSTAFKSMIERLRETGNKQNDGSSMSVVAYNDANDLVGYPLTSDWVLPGVSLTNVLLSNGDSYVGYAENPLEAHSYFIRPQVLKMVIDGSNMTVR